MLFPILKPQSDEIVSSLVLCLALYMFCIYRFSICLSTREAGNEFMLSEDTSFKNVSAASQCGTCSQWGGGQAERKLI